MARNTLNRLVKNLDSFGNFAVYIFFFSVYASMEQKKTKPKQKRQLKPSNSSLTNPFPLSCLALQNTLILLTLTYTLN